MCHLVGAQAFAQLGVSLAFSGDITHGSSGSGCGGVVVLVAGGVRRGYATIGGTND